MQEPIFVLNLNQLESVVLAIPLAPILSINLNINVRRHMDENGVFSLIARNFQDIKLFMGLLHGNRQTTQ
jgi:hypothetical protein